MNSQLQFLYATCLRHATCVPMYQMNEYSAHVLLLSTQDSFGSFWACDVKLASQDLKCIIRMAIQELLSDLAAAPYV